MEGAIRRRTYLGLALPSFDDDDVAAAADAMRRGWVTTGPNVALFQERLERYLEVPHVRCLASCTAGLTLGLKLAGIAPGDEVLVPAMTFVSCANAVVQLGARPVFVDSEPRTGLIDLAHADTLLSQRTRALLPVHVAGFPLDLDAINAFAARHGLAVVEDAAHAIGARWRGRPIGSFGNPTAFSFHATKNMTTFEGGALTLFDEAAAERVERLSLHGLTRSAWSRHGSFDPAGYDVVEPGLKCAMNDVSAGVGIAQLARLDERIERRRAIADAYDERLTDLPVACPPRPPDHARHAHHLYVVALRDDARCSRDEALVALRAANIGASVHFRAIHLYSYYAQLSGLEPEDLPVAYGMSSRVLSLPLFPAMTEYDIDDVVTALAAVLG